MGNAVSKSEHIGINAYMMNKGVQKTIINAVGESEKQRFVASVVSAVQMNDKLAECDNDSILCAALLGESLKLAPSPQLGQYYMVPYDKSAQFQLGWKGYVQLAIRSGQYRKLVASPVKEGELDHYNPITEEFSFNPILDESERNKKPTVGYYGMLELVNGYRKEIYWSREKMEKHAKTYSVAYKKGWNTPWKSDFDAMAAKTIIRQLISKWGVMSIDMQRAFDSDMGVIDKNGNVKYVDNEQSIEDRVAEDIAENANSEEFVPAADVTEG